MDDYRELPDRDFVHRYDYWAWFNVSSRACPLDHHTGHKVLGLRFSIGRKLQRLYPEQLLSALPLYTSEIPLTLTQCAGASGLLT